MRKGSLPGTEWPRAAGEAVCPLLSRAALGQSPAVTGPCVCCGRLRPWTRWAKLTLFLAPRTQGRVTGQRTLRGQQAKGQGR